MQVGVAKRASDAKTDEPPDTDAPGDKTGVPGDPRTLFPPGRPFAWQKAFRGSPLEHVKTSLKEPPVSQGKHAAAWILNLIEAIHWASFPIGFCVAGYIFHNSTAIGQHTAGSVFFIILGLLCQVFGGGISGNMMHVYEGWQVAPFVNPIDLPASSSDCAAPPPPPGRDWIDAVRVTQSNNAWLRATAYQMLFSFQALGLGLFTMAVYGVSAATVALTVGTALVAVLGPKTPRLNLNIKVNGVDRPIMPLPQSLLLVFIANAIINLGANYTLFHKCVEGLFCVRFGADSAPLIWTALGSVSAPLLIAAGGIVEGVVAESTFNQWHHFIAFVILTAGLVVELGMYMLLVASPKCPLG